MFENGRGLEESCDRGVAQEVGSIHMSRKYPSLRDYLRDLSQKIQGDHGPTCVVVVQELQTVDEHVSSTKRASDEGASSLNTTEVDSGS